MNDKEFYEQLGKRIKARREELGMSQEQLAEKIGYKGIDERITKSIVGHAGGSITENVYTHIDLQPMLDAVNKL